MDTEEAKELAAEIEEKGIITAAGYQERYLDIIDKAPRASRVSARRILYGILDGWDAGWLVAREGKNRGAAHGADNARIRYGALSLRRS